MLLDIQGNGRRSLSLPLFRLADVAIGVSISPVRIAWNETHVDNLQIWDLRNSLARGTLFPSKGITIKVFPDFGDEIPLAIALYVPYRHLFVFFERHEFPRPNSGVFLGLP